MAFFPPFPVSDVKQWPVPIQDWFRQLRNHFTDITKKNVAGGVDVNLTSDESHTHVLELSGAITASINIIVANVTKQYTVFNNTTGAFTLTVKPKTGTGITVGQGKRAVLYFDGTNVVRASADV